jgi:hypothetical protein
MSHSILLIQLNDDSDSSRSYHDFDSVGICLESISKMFERHLKNLNPLSTNITYDQEQLFAFLDQLADIRLLVEYDSKFVLHDIEWIKDKIKIVLSIIDKEKKELQELKFE